MKTVWVHQLDDGSTRMLQVGSPKPTSGKVYEVRENKSRATAEAAVRWFLAPAPDLETDGDAYLAHARAQKRVSLVQFTDAEA